MDIYFLRHGEADWPDWNKSDDERPLTKRGKKEMHDVGKFLKRMKVAPDIIVTSPLPPRIANRGNRGRTSRREMQSGQTTRARFWPAGARTGSEETSCG
jgi:broad specificity phosphatase PhoE